MSADKYFAVIDDRYIFGSTGSLDITGIDDVEVEIRYDGKVLWINGPDCKVRICSIRGRIVVRDRRNSVEDAT